MLQRQDDGKTYRAFGLTVRSSLQLPAAPHFSNDAPDVIVRFGPVGIELPDAVSRSTWHQAAPGALLLTVSGVGRYLVGAREIVIDRAPGASDADVLLYLLGSAMGGLLHQREDLVLHGSAIGVGGSAIGFLGVSGAGKSTLAAAFRSRGYQVLTDDLCVIRAGADGVLYAQPGLPHVKLWEDALERLDIAADPLPRVRSGTDKRQLAVANGFADRALPLGRLYVLSVGQRDTVELTPLEGTTRFKTLMDHTYRSSFLDGLQVRASHFRNVVAAAQATPVVAVKRPAHPSSVAMLVDRLVTDFPS